MKIMLDGEEIEVTKIKQSEFYEVLKDKVNILLFGKSGWGKSQIVKRYCNDNELKLKTISLASKLPESIGGIPHATDKGYYEELLSEELKDVFTDDGEGWVIFFDEINQAVPEVLNTLSSKVDALFAGAKINIAVSPNTIYKDTDTQVNINASVLGVKAN